MKLLAPSILAADFSHLGQEIKTIEEAGAQVIHVDVMDGHFVPNISYGSYVMKCLLGKTSMPFDVHLMVSEPDRFIADFVTENTAYITVHAEACTHLHRTVQLIKSHGVKAGVALNPATPVSVLEEILEELDMVLVMSVNPGFGGQKFIPASLRKVEQLERLKKERRLHFITAIDGGINLDNVQEATDKGVELVVAGSSIFGAEDVPARVKQFLDKLNS